MQDLQNVGVHYLLWRVQDWLIPQINNNLAGLKEDIRVRQAACLSFLVAHVCGTCLSLQSCLDEHNVVRLCLHLQDRVCTMPVPKHSLAIPVR